MKPYILFIANILVKLLPSSRFYRFKSMIYRLAGAKIGDNVRVMDIKITGIGSLSIGANTFIGEDTLITGGDAEINIGRNCDISARVILTTGTHDVDMIGSHAAGKGKAIGIRIEDGVWVGIGAIVLPGVVIGAKSVIGAGSVVNKNIPPYTIAAGVPCREIKRWDRDLNSWIKI